MFLASFDFLPLASTLASTYSVMFLVWGLFALIPGMVAAYAAIERIMTPAPAGMIRRSAKNGRIYAVVAGRPPVWGRRGESAYALEMRVLGC